ncbi:MAG: hypothetical protein F6K24_53395, partial [Okeania sp. SIO2D1]|nr:hypothetical protein [Okeania sp. SIO2D1]
MFNIKKYAFVFGILTSTVIGSTFQAYAASIIFDSSTDGFSAANPTSLEGTSFLGQVGNILDAPEISGSLAEQAFNEAVSNNEVDPQAEALIFLTDSNPKSKLKLTFDHPPVVIPGMAIPGAVRIETRRVE